jgi:uncharacterized protein (DUF2141 family)
VLGWAQQTTFQLTGVSKGDGLIRVAFYKTESDYKKEKTTLKFSYSKEQLVLGVMEIKLDLEPGTYAVAFLDDENKDAKMNYNMVGIPKEGYAFSRIKDYGYSKPSFYEARIEVKATDDNTFKVYFNYF